MTWLLRASRDCWLPPAACSSSICALNAARATVIAAQRSGVGGTDVVVEVDVDVVEVLVDVEVLVVEVLVDVEVDDEVVVLPDVGPQSASAAS